MKSMQCPPGACRVSSKSQGIWPYPFWSSFRINRFKGQNWNQGLATLGKNTVFEQHPSQTESHSDMGSSFQALGPLVYTSSQVHNCQELAKSTETPVTSECWKMFVIYCNKCKPDSFNQIWVPHGGFLHEREMFTEMLLFSTPISHSRKHRTTLGLTLPISSLYFRSLTWILITYMFLTHSKFIPLQSDESNALSPYFILYWNRTVTEKQRWKSIQLVSIPNKFHKLVSPKPRRWDGEKVLVALPCKKRLGCSDWNRWVAQRQEPATLSPQVKMGNQASCSRLSSPVSLK